MNTSADRANRIQMIGLRGRDLFWIMSMGLVGNLTIIGILTFGGNAAHLPMTVMVVLANLLVVMGVLGAMDDIRGITLDFDEEEAKTNMAKRFDATPWGAFKALVAIWFVGLALTELYVMWIV
jgi:hypothetical protein